MGINHPGLRDEAFRAKLMRAALVNPTNSDIYTTEFAEFVEVFGRVAMRPYLTQAFFVAGGALGVENALKAAMDWKVRRNVRKGVAGERGHQVLHFREAFHGRSGYTLSLTNTADPRKYQYYRQVRLAADRQPGASLPGGRRRGSRASREVERQAVAEIEQAFAERKDDIAAIIIEPIQAEGGDNHFRPEFMRELRRLADEHEALLIFDEVQSGVGLTGRFWAHEHFDVRPGPHRVRQEDADLRHDRRPEDRRGAGQRLQGVEPDQFDLGREPRGHGPRRSATSRSSRRSGWCEHAAEVGQHLLAGLQAMAADDPEIFSNARGAGLMCAIDFPDAASATGGRQGVRPGPGHPGVRAPEPPLPSAAGRDARRDRGGAGHPPQAAKAVRN